MAIPVDVKTQPIKEFWLNAPCTVEQTFTLAVKNPGAKPLGWRVKGTNAARYRFNPRVGQIPAGQETFITINCKPFTFDPANPPKTDEIIYEWVTAPEGVQKFDHDWFGGGFVIRKKQMKISFNE